jgi:hypothetical protein
MANEKISEGAAAASLDGTEQIPGVQAGGNVTMTAAQIRAYAAANLTGANIAAYSGTGSKIAKVDEDNDADTFLDPGVYYGHGGFASNFPDNAYNHIVFVVRQGAFGSNLIYQVAIQISGTGVQGLGDIHIRVSNDSTPTGWGSWALV